MHNGATFQGSEDMRQVAQTRVILDQGGNGDFVSFVDSCCPMFQEMKVITPEPCHLLHSSDDDGPS